METSYTLGILLRPPISQERVAQRIVDLMATFRTHGLEPMTYAAEAWKTGQIFGAPNITHPDFASRTGDVLWGLSFLTVDVPHAQATGIEILCPAQPRAGGGSAWHWLVKLAEDLCDGLGADLGMINGFAIRRKQGAGGPVYGPEIAPGDPARALFPWMYFGPERLWADQPTEAMRLLPAARSGPTSRGGWVLQATESYSGAAPRPLLEAYAKAFRLDHPPRWAGLR